MSVKLNDKETKVSSEKEKTNNLLFPSRPLIAVPHREIDTTFETEQGKEQKVKDLFSDYVLGRLDPRLLGGGNYDDDTSEELDPMNKFGITFEEACRIADEGRAAAQQIQRSWNKADHPINSNQEQDKERNQEGAKE